MLIDTEFHSIVGKRNTLLNKDVKSSPVVIDNNVWIGGRGAILKGSNIGRNSIIGYGSVVRGDIPKNSVVIGNPAQVVKTLDR
jgi:acetyltransferase-like isoleucine patch superfamily enzyme